MIAVVEVDGFGVVGPPLTVSDVEGFDTGLVELTISAGTAPDSTEYGAHLWVQGCDDVIPDGYYTLVEVAGAVVTVRAAVDDVTVGSASVTGLARIEDHFRISDTGPDGTPGSANLPSWVTGSAAKARWHANLVGMTETAGQKIEPAGGLASVDQVELVHSWRNAGLEAYRSPGYREAATGGAVTDASLSAVATSVSTTGCPIYSGESASVPTGVAQPVWIGLEAIDCRATASGSVLEGVTVYTQTVTRGVLRTPPRPHAEATSVFGRLPVIVGQIVRVFLYPDGATSHADRTEVYQGVVDSAPLEQRGAVQRIRVSSSLLQPRQVKTSDTAQTATIDGYVLVEGLVVGRMFVTSRTGSLWRWALVDDAAAPIQRAVELPVSVSADGIETYEYVGFYPPVTAFGHFPLVRTPDDPESWPLYSKIGRAELAGELRDAFSGTPGPEWERTGWLTLNHLVDFSGGGSFPLAHVFEPVAIAKPRNSQPADYSSGIMSMRYVEVNPVDVLLTVLTATGTGVNGAWDVAPGEFGFGIPLDRIDLPSFERIMFQLESEGISAGTVWLATDEEVDIAKWLGDFCRAYALSIVTSRAGKVRLVDLSLLDWDDTTPTLYEGPDIARPPGASTPIHVGWDMDYTDAIDSVTISYSRPWMDPRASDGRGGTQSAKFEATFRASSGGVTELFGRVRGDTVKLSAPFAVAVDTVGERALAARWARVLEQRRGVVARLEVDTLPSWPAEIGDVVRVTLPNLPGPDGMSPLVDGLARLEDRKAMIRPFGDFPTDGCTLVVYGMAAQDWLGRAWAPSGVVSAVTSATEFEVSTDRYHGINYDTDAETFSTGARVWIFTSDWTLRCDAPGIVDSVDGDEITLSTAATLSATPVTPTIGDKVVLSTESDQPEAQRPRWMWLREEVPGYRWE